ncbi:MAG: microcin C ABC transporter permease YejB [Gammaproteobacteria bacterium]|nr:microcin C ABC transporter permease YejB [Gammaproteobacteria bacterium]MBQ0773930.1 microcin C ABC transporter permease YejB [Gammaproteobacteria bacterium]
MLRYITNRLLLIIPTLLGILLLNFTVIQAAPGGPVEKLIGELKGMSSATGSGFAGSSADLASSGGPYRGSQGLPKELVERIEKMYGFDKPAPKRFLIMVKNYATFDFGESYYKDRSVTELIIERLPVSISLGLWSTLLAYIISIPLGIRKAIKHGEAFDIWSSSAIIVGYAIPAFLFAMLLIVLFAGGSYWDLFPLRGLTSDNWDSLSLFGKATDYLWHITLPTIAIVIGSFAPLTMLTKNSFLDEISKQYVQTARAKGLKENQVLYRHVFRNAMLIVIAGFPAAFVSMFFTGVLLIEYIFSLDGLGLLGFEAVINRDYPVVFGTLFIFTLISLLLKLVSDLTYVLVDPRIDFSRRDF